MLSTWPTITAVPFSPGDTAPVNQPARLALSGGGASTQPAESRPTGTTGASTWIAGILTRSTTEYGNAAGPLEKVATGVLLSAAAAVAGCGGPTSNSPEPFRMSARPVSRTSAITPHGARFFCRSSSSTTSDANIRNPSRRDRRRVRRAYQNAKCSMPGRRRGAGERVSGHPRGEPSELPRAGNF